MRRRDRDRHAAKMRRTNEPTIQRRLYVTRYHAKRKAQREIDRLTAELAAAHARIAELTAELAQRCW